MSSFGCERYFLTKIDSVLTTSIIASPCSVWKLWITVLGQKHEVASCERRLQEELGES